MHGKQLKLRIVGGKGQAKERTPTMFPRPNRKYSALSSEEIPGATATTIVSEQSLGEQPAVKIKAQLLLNEDPRRSRFIYCQLTLIQKISSILTTLIFFLSCCKTEIDIAYGSPYEISAGYIMNALSLCTVVLMLVVVVRHVCLFELQVCQNKVYFPRRGHTCLLVAFCRYSGRLGLLLGEMLLIVPHPCSLLTGYTFYLFQTYDQIYLVHSLNDMLSLLLALKVYIIIRSFLSLTCYSSPRAARLCFQNGLEHNMLYIVKCLLHERPLMAIAVTFAILMMVCGYCLKLSEGVLFIYNAGLTTGFQSYSNCFWDAFITMSTVGYGEYIHKTLLGRAVILITAVFGVFLSSLLIVSLSLYLKMCASESKSHLVLARLGEQQSLLREASLAVAETMKMKVLMSRSKQYVEQKLKKDFQRLKEQVDCVKMKTREVKSLVDTDNVVEEMSRLFYILRGSLKDIFQGQLMLKQEIEKIEQIQRIKMSFIKQVSEMLNKPDTMRSLSVASRGAAGTGSREKRPREKGSEGLGQKSVEPSQN